MVPRMLCSSLRAHWVLFWGVGGANRVLILSLIIGALWHHLWRVGWDGLGGGDLDNVAIQCLSPPPQHLVFDRKIFFVHFMGFY